MSEYKEMLREEILRRKVAETSNKEKLRGLLNANEKLLKIDPSYRTNLKPLAGFIDDITGSNTERRVQPRESVQDALRKAMHSRIQAPKERYIEALQVGLNREMGEAKLAAAVNKATGGNLSTEKQKRLDSARFAAKALDDIDAALDGGSSVLPEFLTGAIGDNTYSEASRRFVEGFGRMQSGGAITADEDKRFARLLPRIQDSPEIRAKKLKVLRDEINARVSSLGGGVTNISQSNPNEFDPMKLSDEQLDNLIKKYGGL